MSEPGRSRRRSSAELGREEHAAIEIDEPASEEEGPRPTRVVAGRDELGRPVDVVEVTDPAAVVDWDERAWHRGAYR